MFEALGGLALHPFSQNELCTHLNGEAGRVKGSHEDDQTSSAVVILGHQFNFYQLLTDPFRAYLTSMH